MPTRLLRAAQGRAPLTFFFRAAAESAEPPFEGVFSG
jgi:hypothetical protein